MSMLPMDTHRRLEEPPLYVVAVVQVNDGEGLVLNRPINLVYERVGNDYLGSDGPFRDLLVYERGSRNAFGGRELALSMRDGSIKRIKDSWWSDHPRGTKFVAAVDIDNLTRCYVFCGHHIVPEGLKALRDTYTGPVHQYDDHRRHLMGLPKATGGEA